MPKNIEKAMPGKNQRNISLSDAASEEFQLVADWLGVPQASLMRQKLEEAHQSPAFASVVRRAKASQRASAEISQLTRELRSEIASNENAIALLDKLESELETLLGKVPGSDSH
ncbi:hypothetical protein N836_31460 [Leptolyngbya sp. Heron Island J]|uniref:hypothetical protein n=1 Tax=Leptolyngbya sp. Heron Island J TaxID=1385935 RepID=UPI0003B977DA|nr:hypothetical protein [Leptolyngbya sp. Heron Island J]ESA38460.1 hypothetical protein N836_31460 [Leptolyngbya sp. Heron Island J]